MGLTILKYIFHTLQNFTSHWQALNLLKAVPSPTLKTIYFLNQHLWSEKDQDTSIDNNYSTFGGNYVKTEQNYVTL